MRLVRFSHPVLGGNLEREGEGREPRINGLVKPAREGGIVEPEGFEQPGERGRAGAVIERGSRSASLIVCWVPTF